jgi:hypothetical protein
MPCRAYSGAMYPLHFPKARRVRKHRWVVQYFTWCPAASLLSSGDAAGVSHAGVDAEQLRQAEVGDLGVHVRVQQDVARLEIAVDDGQPRVLVEVQEPSADPLDDLVPLPPAQLMLPCRICEFSSAQLSAHPN